MEAWWSLSMKQSLLNGTSAILMMSKLVRELSRNTGILGHRTRIERDPCCTDVRPKRSFFNTLLNSSRLTVTLGIQGKKVLRAEGLGSVFCTFEISLGRLLLWKINIAHSVQDSTNHIHQIPVAFAEARIAYIGNSVWLIFTCTGHCIYL